MCEGGGNCLKYLRRRWNRKEGRGNKDFKKGEASWVIGLVEELEPTYELWLSDKEYIS